MLRNFRKNINLLLELCKVRITFFVAVSTFVGFILHSGNISLQIILPSLGVFILASGSSALNEYQEREADKLMSRTKSRPIPSGRINEKSALLLSLTLLIAGLATIFFSSNLNALLLGVLAVIWYNAIYTPLKKKYVMAVVPGSLIGAIPPIIGWAASGGNPFDFEILTVALFFFIWQIPHFWLLLLIFSEDYESAGFPTLTQKFSKYQLSRITFIWITALVTSCLLIPVFSVSSNVYSLMAMIVLGIWLLWKTKFILNDILEKFVFRKAFVSINLYVLAIIVILSIDKLLLQEI